MQVYTMDDTVLSTRCSYLPIWIGLLLLLLQPVASEKVEECRSSKKNYIFYRTMVFTGNGPSILNATRSQFHDEWGTCFDLNKFGDQMVDFYKTYGLEVEQMRQDPYKFYSTDVYDLLPLIYDNNYRLVVSTLFDFSQFANTPVHIAAWELRFKKRHQHEKLDIPAGSYIFYGAYRLALHQRDFCLPFHSKSYVGPSTLPYVPLDLSVFSQEWGLGSDMGLITIKLPYNGNFEIRNVLTFPPEEPDKH